MDSPENPGGPRAVERAGQYQPFPAGTLPSGQMASVRAMQETFLRTFTEELAIRLETPADARVVGVQPLSRSAFLASCAEGGCLIELDADPMRGQALVSLYPNLVAYLLRVFLGGSISSANDSRAVTEIELYILREIFELVERELSAAWKPTGIGFRWRPTGIPEPAAGQGTMLAFDCRLQLNDVEAGLCVAVPAFLARMAALQSAPALVEEAPAPVRNMILNSLRSATVRVEAVLSGSTLRMGDLLAIETGQVLMLSQPAGSPVECRIGGKAKFRGEWVDHGARRALLLQ